MAVTNADVKAFAPQFAAVANSAIDLWISWAAGACDPNTFETDTDQATLLYVCHNLQASQGGNAGAVGAETNRRVGDVSVTHASNPDGLDAGGFKATWYGQQLSNLMRRYTAGPVIV